MSSSIGSIVSEVKSAKTAANLLEAASLLSTVVDSLLDSSVHLLCGRGKHEAVALVALRSCTDKELRKVHPDLLRLRAQCDAKHGIRN